ncbi:MAG: Ig-like domain-containing protein [Sulfitobacter sp.]
METPSTIVTISTDVVDANDGEISLREAVMYASDGDTITFDTSLSTITLDGATHGDIDITGKEVTIDGDHTGSDDKADITLDADGAGRHFDVKGTGTLNLDSLTLINGDEKFVGGGSVAVRSGGTLTVDASTFSGNTARVGGAIADGGSSTVRVNGSTFTGNIANDPALAGLGGAISIGPGTNFSATNTTFAGNSAVGGSGDQGGALNKSFSATVSLTNVTMTGNTADFGGGINGNGNVTLTNTIVSGNTAPTGANIRGVNVIDNGGNVINGSAAALFGTNTLTDNGGPVQTVALAADQSNPALDVGASSATTDARGEARVDQPVLGNNGSDFADSGAYELGLLGLLTVEIAAGAIVETGSTIVTVTRSTGTNGDLDVTLMSGDVTEINSPGVVTIPDGRASVTVELTAADDAVADGTVTTTVTASATGFIDGTDTIDVVDDETAPPPPAAPAEPDLAAGSDSGLSPTDNITNVDTPAIEGSGVTPLSLITVLSSLDGVVGSVLSDALGNWSLTTSQLSEGDHEIRAVETDGTGLSSSPSSNLFVVVDKTEPEAPVVTSIADDTGASATDGVTEDPSLIINGTAEVSSTVEVFLNGVSLGSVMTDGHTGNWSFDHTGTDLANGDYDITAVATDFAGNIGAISAVFPIVVNAFVPPPPPPPAVNQPPSLQLSGVSTEVLRSKFPSQDAVLLASVGVLDDALGNETLALTGADAGLFEIVDAKLFLQEGVDLSTHVGTTLDVTIELDDPSLGSGPEDSAALRFPVINTYFPDVPGNDPVEGTEFDDLFEGGDEIDTVSLPGPSDQYTVTFSPDGTMVEDRTTGAIDTLISIEQLVFGGETVSEPPLDLTQFDGVLQASLTQLDALSEFYLVLFDRTADAPGLFYWATQLADGMSLAEIVEFFLSSPEFVASFGADADTASIVDQVYDNLLDRAPDLAGKLFWTDALSDNGFGLNDFLLSFISGAQTHAADRQAIDDQNDISLYFAALNGLSDIQDATAAKDVYVVSDRVESLNDARDLIDGFAQEVEAVGSNANLLMTVSGLFDDPFVIA